MKKTAIDFTVIINEKVNASFHHLVLLGSEPVFPVFPGQFANIEIPGNSSVFLRRPFSVYNADYKENTLSFLLKIAGRGTEILSKVREGEKLNLVYPLGKGFTLPEKNQKVIMVGGGSGVAPLFFLARRAALPPEDLHLLLGAKSSREHVLPGSDENLATFHYGTEDGTLGEKGMVTDHSMFREIRRFDRIYACGPLPMMKAVASVASREKISCEVSLENLMACGFGVCLCCIEPTVKGNACVCTDGPVFNIDALKW